MSKKLWILCLLLAASMAHAVPDADHQKIDLVIPAGDPQAGREAFIALSCTSCHAVKGDSKLAQPIAAVPVPMLGSAEGKKSPGKIASSIVSPSHIVSREVAGATEGELSPMSDLTGAMTVRQLVDLVAYVRSLDD